MIEACAFLVMFTVQIVAGSVLFPRQVIRRLDRWALDSASERFRELYATDEYQQWVRRFGRVFRLVNWLLAAIGFCLLAWLITVVQQPEWAKAVKIPVVVFSCVQFSPLALLALYVCVRWFKVITQPSSEPKRSALLRRRGLFDFVSPFSVGLAILSYVVFVVFAVHVDLEVHGNTSLSRHCIVVLALVTFMYALNAFIVYKYLYGRKSPLITNEGRSHSIEMNVKSSVYGSTLIAWFFTLLAVVSQQDLAEWQPFALTLFLTSMWMLSGFNLSQPPRKAQSAGLSA